MRSSSRATEPPCSYQREKNCPSCRAGTVLDALFMAEPPERTGRDKAARMKRGGTLGARLSLALDGGLAACDIDRYSAWLAPLWLWDSQLENAFLEVRLDTVGIDAFGEREGVRELPGGLARCRDSGKIGAQDEVLVLLD